VSAAPKEKQGSRKGGKSSESSGTHAKQAGHVENCRWGGTWRHGPALAEHMILEADLIPNTKVPKDNKWDDDESMMIQFRLCSKLLQSLRTGWRIIISGDKYYRPPSNVEDNL
jgi:hypothetical protein